MAIIFSRKGMDSTSGKISSPILSDGRMLLLLIPEKDSDIPLGIPEGRKGTEPEQIKRSLWSLPGFFKDMDLSWQGEKARYL